MYVAQKPCSFGGAHFYIGDFIEDALVHNEAAPRLITSGVIAEVPGGATPTPDASIEGEKQDLGEETEAPEYTEESLMRLKKDQLCVIARDFGLYVAEEATKASLTELILKVNEKNG